MLLAERPPVASLVDPGRRVPVLIVLTESRDVDRALEAVADAVIEHGGPPTVLASGRQPAWHALCGASALLIPQLSPAAHAAGVRHEIQQGLANHPRLDGMEVVCGTGRIGAEVARWLEQRRGGRVVITASAGDRRAIRRAQRLRRRLDGVSVEIVLVD